MRSLSKFCLSRLFHKTPPIRIKIGVMLFIGSFMTFMLRSNFSIIILAMNQEYQWSNYEQNLLLSAYFCGYVGPNLIAGILVERFGGRIIAFLIFLVSSLITALSPYTAGISFELLFASRLALGCCAGFFFSTCHNLISRWAPPSEKGMFVSSLLGSKLGTALTFPLMGFVIEIFNWKWAFYVTAALSLAVSIFWVKIVADGPEKHATISKSEKEYIEDSLSSLELIVTKKKSFPPIAQIMRSLPFHALIFLHFSDVWGVFFLLTSAPMYMNKVLKFDLKDAGLLSSLPYLARFIFGFIFGALGDYLTKRGVGATRIRKRFCILSHMIPGLLLFGFCFVENNPYACIALITLSLGFNGAATMTSDQNPQDLAPNYAASVFGISNFFGTMSGFISPMVVSYITREKSTMTEWRYIFLIDGTLYISSAIFFMIFGSGEVQAWNKCDSSKNLLKV